ncbi:hypothetical protein DO491_24885 [Salmonella enterica]|nr:hypothetical protein [Salmonella enterica]EBS2181529.1 hypothetical protein [Salmonella enterica subsp. enterica serovar Enteritidis]PPW39158.1 hypothetical protein C5P17_26110 [Escherichia coli]EAN2687361.1 hypothetical protein [Salmonella enterica]EAP6070354.1 hypothetical protein [Salmonella enterica]
MQREKPPEWREKQKGSRGIRRGQRYRLVFQFPIRQAADLRLDNVNDCGIQARRSDFQPCLFLQQFQMICSNSVYHPCRHPCVGDR